MFFRSKKKRIVKRLGCFAVDRKGVAAVEFAYIAPLLIVALFGTVEVARAVLLHKRYQRVSAMISDLVSRELTIGTAPGEAAGILNGMMESAKHIMSPFPISDMNLRVTSLRAKSDDANRTRAEWTYEYKTHTAASTCTDKPMPKKDMIQQGNTAIVAELTYKFTPLFANLIPGFSSGLVWRDTMTNSPRKASCVGFEGSNCGELCPGW